MAEQIYANNSSRISSETRELILHVRKRRWKYFAIVTLIGCYFFYFFKYQIMEYSSTVSFVMNEPSFVTATPLDPQIPQVDNFSRIYELVNSIPTQKHMIEKFGLFEHYGIDSANEFYLQKAIARLQSKITVKKSPFNTISITVKDVHRYLAAEMANEMVAYIEQQNQNSYISKLTKRIQIAEAYVKQLNVESNRNRAGIDSVVTKVSSILQSGRLNENGTAQFTALQQKLAFLVYSFENSSTELINSQKLYNISLQALNFQVYPTINVIGTAMPAYRSTSMIAFMYSILAMVLVLFALVLQGLLYMYYKEYINLILKGK